jgi:sarcosine oxidase
MAGHLPGAIGPALQTKTCLYTLTPDRDFVLDRVPGHPGVIVALGAAHAYKFAALFGRELAALALDSERRAPRPELAMFSLDRPGLAAGRTTNLVESA